MAVNSEKETGATGVISEEFLAESRHLKRTRELILREKERLETAIDAAERTSEQLKAAAWEDHLELKDSVNLADNAVTQQELMRLHQQMTLHKRRIAELDNMYRAPYFGRLDLLYEGESDVESFYIGLRPLFDPDTYESYILDWRTPVASLFYEADLGPTCYKTGQAHVKVEVTGKKNFVIKHGKLIKIYDSDDRLYDEHLQLVLAEGSTERMQDIVSTIQAEQNRVIRRAPDASLLLTGVGGSGKTSIALHRLAYLLFRQSDLTAKNCLLISPNEEFSDYVSDLLPVLADDMLNSDTYINLLLPIVGNDIEPLGQKRFTDAGEQRVQASASPDMLPVLDDFIVRFSRANLNTEPIDIAGHVISTAEQEERLSRYAKEPHFKQAALLTEDLLDVRRKDFDHAAKKKFRKVMEKRYRETELLPIYRAFLTDDDVAAALPEIALPLDDRRLDRVDLTILCYLKQRLFEAKTLTHIYQLIIDEFQDMTLLEHVVTASLFNCPVNLYGDVRQAIRFVLPEGYLDDLAAIYGIPDDSRVDLLISYRSTREITEYSGAILGDTTIEAFHRQGDPVVEQTFSDADAQVIAIRDAVERAVEAEHSRIAVICENYSERKQLRREVNRRVYDEELKQFRTHHVFLIMTVDEAKGLEYDAVIIANRNNFDERTVKGRTRLYVACSRALHQLTVLSEG